MHPDFLNIGAFAAAVIAAATILAFGWRLVLRSRNRTGEFVTLSEPARKAYRQARAEHLAMEEGLHHRAGPDAFDLFERSFRHVGASALNPDSGKASRADLRRYAKWARDIQ